MATQRTVAVDLSLADSARQHRVFDLVELDLADDLCVAVGEQLIAAH